jgi:hypothetical protein
VALPWVKERLRPRLYRKWLSVWIRCTARQSKPIPPLNSKSSVIEVGPRLTGSMAQQAAARQAVAYMRKIGLQQVHTEGWSLPRGWRRGPAAAWLITPFEIPIPYPGWRNIAWLLKKYLQGQKLPKLGGELDQHLKSDFELKVLRIPVRARKANAYCERLVGTVRRECLDS